MRLLGIDPGLRFTGWGIIESQGNRLDYVAAGVIKVAVAEQLAPRLLELYHGLVEVVQHYQPAEAAVEEIFVNKNATSTLKLGHARAMALLVPALAGLTVAEYATNLVKKSIVGNGHATKEQIQLMIKLLLPGAGDQAADAADALAVAICHAHLRQAAPHRFDAGDSIRRA